MKGTFRSLNQWRFIASAFLLIALQQVNSQCIYEGISGNAVPGDNYVACVDIPDNSDMGDVVCQFYAHNADSLDTVSVPGMQMSFNQSGFENGTYFVQLIVNTFLYEYVDQANPHSDQRGTFHCHDLQGNSNTEILEYKIADINTKAPAFQFSQYDYGGLPFCFPYDVEISSLYDRPIQAIDLDNYDQGVTENKKIEFTLEGSDAQYFSVVTKEESIEYPATYTASLFVQKNLIENTTYAFVVRASNPDGLSSTAQVAVLVRPENTDLAPEFKYGFYRIKINEKWVKTPGKYQLDVSPVPIHAVDQDLRGSPVVYSINADPNIDDFRVITDSFKIDKHTGTLTFVNLPKYDYTKYSTLAFTVRASQIDNNLKNDKTSVTVLFQN